MKQLFITEFLQFRKWAFGIAVFHFLLLFWLYSLGANFTADPASVVWMTIMIFLCAGFGYLQMRLHKRSNEWLYLLHRPLTHGKIFLAVTLAATLLILISVFLPALLMLMIMDLDGLAGIEFRHYLFPGFVIAPALVGYFCGSFIALSPNRLAFLCMVLATCFINPYMDTWIVPASWLVLAIAMYLAWHAFKPDLESGPATTGYLLAEQLPIQYGVLWGTALVLMLFMELSRDANNGGQRETVTMNANGDVVVIQGGNSGNVDLVRASITNNIKEDIKDALDNSGHPDAAFLGQQVNLAINTQIVRMPHYFSYPERYQLPRYDNKIRFIDDERNVIWTFHHNEMLFEGRELETKTHVGWLGPGGFFTGEKPDETFPTVPWVNNGRFIITDHSIYQIDLDNLAVVKRFNNSGPGRFNDSLSVNEVFTTQLSENMLYIFDTAEFMDIKQHLEPRASVPLVGQDFAGARNLSLLELIDGFLVTTTTGWRRATFDSWNDFAGYGDNHVIVQRVIPGVKTELIADIREDSNVSEFRIFHAFVTAPGMRLLTDLIWGVILKKDIEHTLPALYVRFPTYIWLLTIPVCLFSAGATAWLLRNSRLKRQYKVTWVVLNALTGLAGLLSFLVGTYWRKAEQLKIPLRENRGS